MKPAAPVPRSTFGRLAVEICRDREALGRVAARACAAYLREVVADRGEARVVFAGLPATAPQSRRHYLAVHLLERVSICRFHGLDAEHPDAAAACARYAALLAESPIDLICLGMGENGHLAFNDPSLVDFDDTALVKPVELDATCRQQQVHDGCFSGLEAVPAMAPTITLPVFRRARRRSIHVPRGAPGSCGAGDTPRGDHHRVPGDDVAPASARHALPRAVFGRARVHGLPP